MTPLPSAAPLPPGCPWSGWAPPNVQWCEENLCALVTAPANTWSNLAYIVVGLVMWAAARRLGRSDLRFYGPAAIVVGVFSLAYHASYTFFFQFFDFVGMFVFLDLVILVDLGRLGRLQPKSQLRSWWLMVAASSALVPPLFFAGIPIQLLVAATIAVWVPLEFVLWRARGGLWAVVVARTGAFCDCRAVLRSRRDPRLLQPPRPLLPGPRNLARADRGFVLRALPASSAATAGRVQTG